MRGEDKQQFIELCEKAADEQDLNRLQELTADIILAPKMKARRLSGQKGAAKADGVFRRQTGAWRSEG